MLFIIVINWLVRSGRLNKVLLFSKNVYQKQSLRFSKAGIIGAGLMALSFTAGSNPLPMSYPYFGDSLPVPVGINNQLFYLQRDPDANTVVYKLNMKDGQLVNNEPVSAFWIRYDEDGQVQALTTLQKRLAYGIKSKLIAKGKYELRFASYSKLPLYLLQSDANAYYVCAMVQHKKMVLNRIFVRVKDGSFNIPKVVYIELSGKDAETGKQLTHRINI
ncbi:MAG: CDP-alcohol phosphatidyltransferase [Sphingobacteriales bacterium]|nr:CDP-alcohol phosphatidyltransferase [Sphingobacteriales bacterium]